MGTDMLSPQPAGRLPFTVFSRRYHHGFAL